MSENSENKGKSPLDKLLDQVDWQPSSSWHGQIMAELGEAADSIPFITHSGVLKLGEMGSIHVVMLSDGQRIIPEGEIERVFPGWKELMAKTGHDVDQKFPPVLFDTGVDDA